MSLDTEREIVFIPTGSASFDYYGGDRHGDNLFANCLLALNANTGERLWHYQFVRHDLWDRDLPAPPNLLEIERDGKKVDVVAQITKSGYVFMFDRETGTPIFQIDEIPAEPSNLVGEYTAATQPLPSAPPPFSRQTIYKEDLATRTDAVAAWTDSIWNISHKNHQFRPLDLIPSLIFPGLDGGGEWGGAATDPQGIMYVNSSQMAWILGMQEFNAEPQKLLAGKGQIIYQTLCQNCHAEDRSGTDLYANIPTLIGLKDRQLKNATTQIIKKGKGIMPAFSNLADKDIDAIVAFLHESDEINNDGESDFWPYPYRFAGFNRFNAPDGHPGIKPPWGLITALDLNEGTIKWQSVLGDVPALRNANDPATGTENYGGPVATAGGIIFIAATKDNKIRAFDSENGKELWSHELPVPGYATPATYMVDGKQYVVIACGGGKIGSPSGDSYIAFALKD